MFDNTRIAPATSRHPALIEQLPDTDESTGTRCRVHHAQGAIDAWAWIRLDVDQCLHGLKGHAVTMEIDHGGMDHLLVAFEPDPDLPLRLLLSPALCPIEGVVDQAVMLVDGLAHDALRRFVGDALLMPDAVRHFWTRPASWSHHHAYSGGLAEHSLEVATMAATARGLPGLDRELGIALALLHDFGKIWCFGPPAAGPKDWRRHERIGLERLRPLLTRLQGEDADVGAQVEELLGGRRAPRESRYPLAIGRIIHAFDQMSCEANRRLRVPF